MDYWLLVGVLFAFVVGYTVGRGRQKRKQRRKRHDRYLSLDDSSQQYINGLNYLLSDKGDAAAEAFIDALPVAEATLQTHISLGRMLRKKGEVSSAIRTHQSLLASPFLDGAAVDEVQLELAVDYVSAGLFDRAQAILVDLVGVAAVQVRQASLGHLVSLYRDEGEWQKAIDVINRCAERRFVRIQDQWTHQQSHFCCELVTQNLASGQYSAAQRQLRQALRYDKRSVRAGLLAASLDIHNGDFSRAVKRLKKLVDINGHYWPQYMPLFDQCYQGLRSSSSLKSYLFDLSTRSVSSELKLWVVARIRQDQGEEEARAYLESMLDSDDAAIALRTLMLTASSQDQYQQLRPFVFKQLQEFDDDCPNYQCRSCGFTSRNLLWLCPGCKSWGSSESHRRSKLKSFSLVNESAE